MMFMDIDKKPRNSIAAIDDMGGQLSYGELCSFVSAFQAHVPERGLLFSFCENTLGSLAVYVAAQSCRIVPLLLSAEIDMELCRALIETYLPSYLWVPKTFLPKLAVQQVLWETMDCVLLKTGLKSPALNEDLSLLLTTSGSTGSPKLVRQSRINIRSNAESIKEYLELTQSERPITTLPMNYTYGLSIINSHLLVGATILMTTKSIMQKEFWDFFQMHGATSLAGVPYHYEMLKRLHFFHMQLPSLKTMTQAGGKLMPELHKEFAQYAKDTGRKFFVMYGQTEATARMGYLPYQRALDKYGSMGIAIPGGQFWLIDSERRVIEKADEVGELVYEGPNVMLGYATCAADLGRGDDCRGILHTGDMARRDADGFYYIVGRKKRFLKIFGNRVNLDECEQLIKSKFHIECACTGKDDFMGIFVSAGEHQEEISKYISEKTRLHPSAFKIYVIEKIPKTASGKIQYQELRL